MNNKQMLCIALAVLHTESQLTTPNSDHEIIRKVIRECRLPEYVEEDDERGSLLVLKDIISNIIDGDVEFSKTSILKQIRLESTQNKAFYESIAEYLEEDEDLPKDIESRLTFLSKQLGSLYFQLRNALSSISLRQTMGKAFGALNGTERHTDLETCLNNLKADLTSYSSRGHSKIPSLVADLCTSNPTHFVTVFNSIAEKAAGGGLKTGWQSVNRMMGVMEGLSEEMWLMPALPFNCKSLFSLSMCISVPLFNTPEHAMRNVKGTKQPIILDLSLENEVDINIAMAYQMIYGHFEGVAPDMEAAGVSKGADGKTQVTSEGSGLMAEYFCEKLQRNGWTYRFQKHTNDNFKVHYIQDLINDLEQQGYHVVGVRADYLGTINKTGHGNGIAGSDIKEIYRIARNIQVVRNKGFLLGPHQISPEGKRLRAIDEAAFVKSLPGRGLYDTCSSLDNEADGEMFFGKRIVEGRSYLEVQRGKHRTIIDTPEKNHYTVLPFSNVGILPWDVDRDEEVTANSINKFAGGFGEDCII